MPPVSVNDAFANQAKACEELGSPFTAELCRVLARRLDRSTAFGSRILDWPGDPVVDALPLRACAALHALAISRREPMLRQVYPPAALDPDLLWVAIADSLARQDAWLTGLLDGPPQTNEVARSALILGGVLWLAAFTRLPIELYEIGASAGLNLGFDAYRYDFGAGRGWGDAAAPLSLTCDWRGELPPVSAHISVVGRQGCDRNPLDPADDADALRLMSFVWADQTHRLARLRTALQCAADAGRKVARQDAADWVEWHFGRPLKPGVCRLLLHTIMWQYLPPATQARIDAALEQAAAGATEEMPLARLAIEADGRPDGAAMTLTLWPGARRVPLGRGDFHGRWAEWLPVQL